MDILQTVEAHLPEPAAEVRIGSIENSGLVKYKGRAILPDLLALPVLRGC